MSPARPITGAGMSRRHDDGHPLRPTRIPPPSPQQRAAAERLAAAPTGAAEVPFLEGASGSDSVDLQGARGVADLSVPADMAAWPEVLGPPHGGPRFLTSRLAVDAADPVRAQAMRAPAWVELRPSAWLITRESGSVVYASDLVYTLLGRTRDELEALLSGPDDASPGYAWIRRTVIDQGHAGVVLRIAQSDGDVREVEVVSRRLPGRVGEEDRYFSVLTLHEG